MTPRSLIGPARLAGAPLLRSQSDERLVDLVRAGYEPAFEAIVARYRRALLRYCSGFLAEARAEDVVQQTFVNAYRQLSRTEGEMQLRPWLYRIAHNTALNSLRDRGLDHDELDEHIDGVERPDQAFERHERLREVVAAVSALPERQRDAVILRELEGRSYDEIAAELGVSDGAVRQLLNRARNTMRAAAAAVVPAGLVTRLPWSSADQPMSERVGELVTGVGGGALVTKVAATALVTGAVVGGVATSPDGGAGDARADRRDRDTAADARRPGGGSHDEPVVPRVAGAGPADDDRGRGRGRGGDDDEDDDDRSGRDDGDDDSGGDDSGPGSDDDDRSGPGGGDDDGDSSGPGSDDDGDSSGSGSSGSGTSGSGSSGSETSGSGSSGSGSQDSGSDSSGSGSGGTLTDDSSGSGSSGSGSDELSTD